MFGWHAKTVCVFFWTFAFVSGQLDLPPYEDRDQPPPFRPNNVQYTVGTGNQYDRNNGRNENVNVVQNTQNFDNLGGRTPQGAGPYARDIRRLLQALDVQASQQCTNNVAAQWNFETNVNQVTQLEAVST